MWMSSTLHTWQLSWSTMLQSSGKCAASSPLNSEFNKRPRLGLTEEQVNNLNECICYWIQDFPHYAQFNAEDALTRALVLALQQVALKVLDTSCASNLDKSWQVLAKCQMWQRACQSAITQGTTRSHLLLGWGLQQRGMGTFCESSCVAFFWSFTTPYIKTNFV